MTSLTAQNYHIGWICALNIEMTAAMAMLDEEHEMLPGQDPQDHNSYVLGRIHQHNVVIACMPEGVDGLVPAANVAKDMARTFPALRIGLMVGIGGGIPDLAKGVDIRLGDIVVSKPEKTLGGVVQYDKGKAENGGKFVVKGQLNAPPALLLQTLAQLRARHAMRPSKVSNYISEAITRNPMMEESGFTFPSLPDCFYCSVCDKDIESSIPNCEGLHTKRNQRKNHNPVVHYGVIASGNQVVKDAAVRDRLRDEFNAFCVEMEAAGLMNEFPCLVIRGICDYADLHKNDGWHPYAAMAAAAYAKEFLQYITPARACQEQPIQNVLGLLDEIRHSAQAQLEATQAQTEQSKTQYESDKHSQCHRTFKIGAYENQKDINHERVAGTCQWVLSNPLYRQWTARLHDDLLWISADPGCGKSVLARFLVDEELRNTDKHTVCYFFFKDSEEQDNLMTALCALLHQLFSNQPRLIRYAIPAWEKTGDKLQQDVLELWRILLAGARDEQARDVTCVLDALDECRLPDRQWLINMLTKFYTGISATSSVTQRGRLKFLVTSRPYDDIQAEFQKTLGNLPTIRLRGEEKNDQIHQEIDLVIRMRVTQLAEDLGLQRQIKEQLESQLLEMDHRTYLWLHLAIEDIRETYKNSLRPEEAAIKSLPSTVEEAYEKILSRINEEQRSNVKKILQIVVGARRPLSVQEMAIALGLATSPHHKSLHEARIDPSLVQKFDMLSRIDDFLEKDDHVQSFLVYSSEYWPSHLRDAEMPTDDSAMTRLSQLYATDGPPYSLWFAIFWKTTHPYEIQPRINSIRLAALLGHEKLLQLILQSAEHHKINEPDDRGRTALMWASQLGYDKAVQILLNKGADVSAQGGEYGNALQAASAGGHERVAASAGGHERVVQMLLDARADVNAQGGEYGNALQAASARGHERVVMVLRDAGAVG
ncbi:uncharacterized protein Z518_06173 [Rhinocladiella mackenziei CBS 650.93]|uniref:Nucleoside phosphorylase domain-containing protein n=1 Tax=Rhinocladiella mackenziei CBS 650.93 TaxID=1442369 RepID=A0A0D2IQ37_9EURO|nr:uncharacterized protein Z518_06173 [Rhinocladiella mackenziei CBS 650.93]KIX05301.1 hypothetical protein Z518_06173 [Rhinocladiella mackenziei CBS 650.93]